MSIFKRLNLPSLLKAFGANRRASVVVLLGIAIVPMLGVVGLVSDAARAYLVQSRLAQAVDSAALAGGSAITAATRDADINNYFQGNFPTGYLDSTLQPLTINADLAAGTVEVVAQAQVPTSFLRVLTIDHVMVSARSVVNRAVRGMELALVLDVTGSMGGSKIAALKSAAHSLLNILYGSNDTVTDFWVSVVPFASRVNIEPNSGWMVGPPNPWNGCGDTRSGTNATDDSPPSVELFPEYTPTVTGWRPPDYGCPETSMLPLTASKTTVGAKIDDLEAFGNTRTDVGMVWGWRSLSPQWRGVWPGDPTLPLDYNTALMDKVVIIMTDGENTPWLTGDPVTQEETNTQLAQECTDMKTNGITIYTITFQAPSSLDPLFEACASDPSKHFISPSNADLQNVFIAIGTQLSNLRISQ